MPRPRRRPLVLLAVLAALLAVPGAALAQCPRTTLADVEDEVMCPVCGVPLGLAADAPQAQAEREFIRELIADCASKQEVKQALRAEFGDEVLALPDDEGFDLAAYLVPALALLGALAALALAALRWRRVRPQPGGAPGEEPDAADSARLDEELRRFDG